MELDPYWKWLGIPPEQQPPDHYVLLGLAPFETNRDVIENAAVRQMSHVRSFQGAHVTLSQQLLNELSAARLCLLDQEQKQIYDQKLRLEMPAPNASEPLPVAAQVMPGAQLPVAEEVASVSSSARRPQRSRRRRQRRHAEESRLAWTIILFLVAALLVCVAIGIFIYKSTSSGATSDMQSSRFYLLSMVDSRCLDNAC